MYLWCLWLVLWWVVVLEQAGGLHGVIRWFKFILGVFLISCKCEWNLLIRCNEYYFIDFNTCKHCTCDVCDWFCGGLCWIFEIGENCMNLLRRVKVWWIDFHKWGIGFYLDFDVLTFGCLFQSVVQYLLIIVWLLLSRIKVQRLISCLWGILWFQIISRWSNVRVIYIKLG